MTWGWISLGIGIGSLLVVAWFGGSPRVRGTTLHARYEDEDGNVYELRS